MKKSKNELKPNTVISDNLHVGIELELCVPNEGGRHDDYACFDARMDSQRGYLMGLGSNSILREYFDLSRDAANALESYFDADKWIERYMHDYNDECDGDCAYMGSGDASRNEIAQALKNLTGNTSFKVVEDSSIRLGDGSTDAEVCWNYHVSKETVKDNAKILEFLKNEIGADHNKSCGLHINLNNYLKIPEVNVDTEKLDFLFNLVAPSRRGNTHCNHKAISKDEKYSMIYHQGDRLEFRFFSPTLEADKLNHYVTLANVIYRRLAGLDAKLPKKTASYMLDKMTKVNEVSPAVAQSTINAVNSIPEAYILAAKDKTLFDVEDLTESSGS